MRNLKVTPVQCELVWEDARANLKAMDQRLSTLEGKTDLVILPEMFTTGFTMNGELLAEPMEGPAVKWLLATSRQIKAVITGSLIIKDGGRLFNRLVWATPDGGLFRYDKRHLFRMAEEHRVYAPGTRLITVSLSGWRIRPFVCYDLRFPVWSRNTGPAYDVALYVANWPARRAAHWMALLVARAIENQCYVIGVNRVGLDGNGIDYAGDSMIVDPLGEVLWHRKSKEALETVELDFGFLSTYREDFPAWKDADTE